jgi:hypothetical protein
MKKLIFIFVVLAVTNHLYGQEADSRKITLKIGCTYFPNFFFNESYDTYYTNPQAFTKAPTLGGFNTEISVSTKNKHLYYMVGSTLVFSLDQIDRVINGGGVYGGLNTKFGGKYFGLNFDFGIGAFSFKDQAYASRSGVDVYENNATAGLGGITKIGFYAKYKRIGIAPNFQAIYSGSSSASLLLNGFNLPITIDF